MQKNSQWKSKMQEILQVCQDELKKTTEIGKKMLEASKTNSNLHEAYEELGILAAKAFEEKKIKWEDPKVKKLMETIDSYKQDLKEIENDVNKIKFPKGASRKKDKAAKTDEKEY